MTTYLLFVTLSWLQAIETPHFRFVPDEKAVGTAEHLAKIAEDKRRFVLSTLGISDERVIEVRIASSDETMQEVLGNKVMEWVAGLAISSKDLIVMSTRGNEVFRASDTFVHELAHIYLDAAVGERPVPRWFHEGVAMLVASEELGERLKSLMAAAATGSLIPIEELSESFPRNPPLVHLAYAESMMFVRFLDREKGGIRSVIEQLRAGMPFEHAFTVVYGSSVGDVWERFVQKIDRTSSLLVYLTTAGIGWLIITLLFLYVYMKKRRRARARREAWANEEELAKIAHDHEVN